MTTWVREDDMPPRQYPDEEGHPSLVWLRERWEAGDIKTLDSMVSTYKAFEAFGRAGEMLRRLVVMLGKGLAWFAAMWASYFYLSGEAAKWWSGGR